MGFYETYEDDIKAFIQALVDFVKAIIDKLNLCGN